MLQTAESRLRFVNTVIIDEISMCTQGNLAEVDQCISGIKAGISNGCVDSGEPFGNVDMIFSGDFLQLPCVGDAQAAGLRHHISGKGSQEEVPMESA